MRKMSTTLLKLLTLLLVLAISLCSCDAINGMFGQDKNDNTENSDTTNPDNENSSENGGEHTHTLTSAVTAPTCIKGGFTKETCECGYTNITNRTEPAGHSYTTGKCTVCGEKDPNYKTQDQPHVHEYEGGKCIYCGKEQTGSSQPTNEPFDYNKVPEFSGENYVVINGNVPYFTSDEITNKSFETYQDLDSLGRATLAFASLGMDLMPTESRPSISYKPTGWVQNTYPTSIVPTTSIYNRSHLIAWALSGEGNNAKNLITGTPYFNQIGMQLFETLVLDYIKETANHVMYRVTPVYVGNELVARGVLMEGWSVEDNGEGICFCVFMYNVQPGITIEYATGENYLTDAPDAPTEDGMSATLVTDLSQLTAGSKIIIVAKDADLSISTTQNNNNRATAVITKDGNVVYFDENTQVITIGNGSTSGTYSFGVDGGYLYAASSDKNYLRTQSNLDVNASWSISIGANGVATVKATGPNKRNLLGYNSQNKIFSVYAEDRPQGDVCIYIVNE